MERGQQQGPERNEEEQEAVEQELGAKALQNEQLSADVDSILDEIDDVLEENAEEFVRSYVQKGGQ